MDISYKLPVTILKEKKRYVAYSPAIDLSSSGETFSEAQKRFAEASLLFFEEIIEEKTMDDVLSNLGWSKMNKTWKPPMVIAQQSETITIPTT